MAAPDTIVSLTIGGVDAFVAADVPAAAGANNIVEWNVVIPATVNIGTQDVNVHCTPFFMGGTSALCNSIGRSTTLKVTK